MSTGDSFYGHAFNVDGYHADDDTYHVNFGQSEERNGWYAFNAFGYGITIYKYFQLMFVGVKPTPEGVAVPPRIVAHAIINQLETTVGGSVTKTIDVIGLDLTDDITVTVTDENGFVTTDVATIALNQLDAANHKVITATYNPTDDAGMHFAYITLSSPGAEPLYIYFYDTANGTSQHSVPGMQPANDAAVTDTSFVANWHHTTSPDYVESYTLEVNGNEIADIAEKSFTVEGLASGMTYSYRVKAVYTDGTESDWSNVETVTLSEDTPAFIRGDVNDDHNVTITDVTALINYLLSGNPTGVNLQAADCDEDGFIKINDVATLINYLLNNNVW